MKGASAEQLDVVIKCIDCDEAKTVREWAASGEHLFIVGVQNAEDPLKSSFRCECCEDDWRDKNLRDADDD